MASLGVLKRISGNTFDHDVVAFGALKRTRFKARAIRRDAREHRANAAAFADRTLYGCRFHDAPSPKNSWAGTSESTGFADDGSLSFECLFGAASLTVALTSLFVVIGIFVSLAFF